MDKITKTYLWPVLKDNYVVVPILLAFAGIPVAFTYDSIRDFAEDRNMILPDFSSSERILGLTVVVCLGLAVSSMRALRKRGIEIESLKAQKEQQANAKQTIKIRFLDPVFSMETFHLPIINDGDATLTNCSVKITYLSEHETGKEFHTPIAIAAAHNQSTPAFDLRPGEETSVFIARRGRNQNTHKMLMEFMHSAKQERLEGMYDGTYDIEITLYSELGSHKQSYRMVAHEKSFTVERHEKTNTQ